MKRVIQFSKARYYFFAFSALLVLIGVAGYVINHGFNLGVDFRAGIELQFQIAPASFTVQYTGPDKAEISIPAGEEALTSAGNIIISITSAKDGTRKDYPFRYADYSSVRDLTAAITKAVPGVAVRQVGDMNAVPTQLVPLTRPQNISGTAVYINLSPGAGRGAVADMADMRTTLAALGQVELQAVGPAGNQEFIARLEAKTDDPSFQQSTEASVQKVLETRYGAGQVIMKQTNFIGRRVAQSLGTQAIWLVLVAVALILLYMMFRFRPPIYAVAAIIGIVHDSLVMLSFDAVFRIEIDATTIAAILTILGYSINDTIVIFDRVRENKNLMRGSPLRSILDTSVTQTLSRTFITSGATLLTVIALFILTTGSLKNFSLNMIIGIVEGTYSTFISSFIVLEWTKMRDRQKKSRDLEKYGIGAGEKAPVEAAAAVAEEEAEAVGADEAVEQVEPEQVAVEVGGAEVASDEQPAQARQGAEGHAPAAATHDADRPVGSAVAFSGHSGSRKNKKHKRRHR